MKTKKEKLANVCISLFLLFAATITSSWNFPNENATFRNQQKQFKRVKNAYEHHFASIQKHLKDRNIDNLHVNILLRYFKQEQELEIWVSKNKDSTFTHYKSVKACSYSGELGPKLKKGDLQTPEGIYYIDRFNPGSSFHLSLGINYPNTIDKNRSKGLDPGGDIFIHGSCVTIGCIPIEDNPIEELYVLCVESFSNGQSKIPVQIFPAKMTEKQFQAISIASNNKFKTLWEDLKKIYTDFNKNKMLRKIELQNDRYLIN